MKKLFITLFILFTTLTTQAQKQFEGEWVSKTSSYVTTVIASDYAVLKVFNFALKKIIILKKKYLCKLIMSLQLGCIILEMVTQLLLSIK